MKQPIRSAKNFISTCDRVELEVFTVKKIELPKGAALILDKLHAAGYEAYVVGGCVRDSLLGKEPKDWDICTSAVL